MKKLLFLFQILCFSISAWAYSFTTNGIYYNITSSNSPFKVEVTYDDVNGNSYTGAVSIPATVTYQGQNYSVTSIGYSAFYGNTSLTSITIPNSVTSINLAAFSGCTGLTTFNIPSNVSKLYEYIFEGCLNLSSFTVDAGNLVYSSKDGVLFNKNQSQIIKFPGGKTGRYLVPVTVTSTVSGGFDEFKGISALSMPNYVSNFDLSSMIRGRFSLPNLKYFNLPAELFNDVKYDIAIYERNIRSVDTLIINSGVLKDFAFELIRYGFPNCKFLDLSMTTNTSLPKSALLDLNEMEEVILPAGLTSLSYRSIADCVSLKSIQIPASVTEIGMCAFENCRSMENVNFGTNSQLKTIDNWAFYACHGLKDIVIPTGVTNVGDGAFWGCEYLSDLTLPSTVQKINDNGFDGCIGLSKIKVEATLPPVVSAKTFNRVNKNASIYVPDASVSMYKNAFGWKDFFNIKGISTQVQELDEPSYGIRIIDRNIEITNAKGSKINVYDISGRVLFTKTASEDSENIQLSNKGVYLLAIDGFNRKIIVD
jgi:hypothetical protein